MTPLERAEKAIAGRFVPIGPCEKADEVCANLIDSIRLAIIEATNAEVEKRRAVEAECARLRRIVEALSRVDLPVPFVIDAGDKHLRLTVRNPVTGDDWEYSFTKRGEVGHGR